MEYSKEFIEEAANKCFEYFKNLPIGSSYSTHYAVMKLYGEMKSVELWRIDTKVRKVIRKSLYLIDSPYGVEGIPYDVGFIKMSDEKGDIFTKEQRFDFLKKAEAFYLNNFISEKDRNFFNKEILIYNLTHGMIAKKCIEELKKLEFNKKVTFQLIFYNAIGFVPDLIYKKEEIQSIYDRFLYYAGFCEDFCLNCVIPLRGSKHTNIIWKEVKSQ